MATGSAGPARAPSRFVNSGRECLRQEHPATLLEAGPRVMAPRRMTFGAGLHEQSADPQFVAHLPDRRQGGGSEALSPVGRADEEVIDESAKSPELHAEGQGEYQVANRPFRPFH